MKRLMPLFVGVLLVFDGAYDVHADDWSAISVGGYTQLGHFNSASLSATLDGINDQARSTDGSTTNWSGGFSLAANWRLQNAVIGVGVDYDPFGTTLGLQCHYHWDDGRQSNVYVSWDDDGRCTREVSWSTSIVGRVGWLVSESTLLYGVGGWAIAKVEQNFEKSFYLEQASATLSGATFGGGIEHRLAENWHVSLEFRHTAFGTIRKTSFLKESDGIQNTNVGGDTEIVRLGLSYVLPLR